MNMTQLLMAVHITFMLTPDRIWWICCLGDEFLHSKPTKDLFIIVLRKNGRLSGTGI